MSYVPLWRLDPSLSLRVESQGRLSRRTARRPRVLRSGPRVFGTSRECRECLKQAASVAKRPASVRKPVRQCCRRPRVFQIRSASVGRAASAARRRARPTTRRTRRQTDNERMSSHASTFPLVVKGKTRCAVRGQSWSLRINDFVIAKKTKRFQTTSTAHSRHSSHASQSSQTETQT